MANSLKQRLLHDIAEIQTQPYPNIDLQVNDEEITTGCLILTTPNDRYGRIHLTITFPSDYPLRPPKVRMDSDVEHPNVYMHAHGYICVSILDTRDGYTPAYTLKGIAIQLLSFFTSEYIEQENRRPTVALDDYLDDYHKYLMSLIRREYHCEACGFSDARELAPSSSSAVPSLVSRSAPTPPSSSDSHRQWSNLGQLSLLPPSHDDKKKAPDTTMEDAPIVAQTSIMSRANLGPIQRLKIPSDVLLQICEELETIDMMLFAQAWSRIGHVITDFDVIHTRELQCFCLKKNYKLVKLGVGVSTKRQGRFGFLESEFDLLSEEGFSKHKIRRSVQGLEFSQWLPLPISHGHWEKVKDELSNALSAISNSANLGNATNLQVVFRFMNDVVVKLNRRSTEPVVVARPRARPQSTLTHASEKAIECYFHLFHLLLCMATAAPMIVNSANRMLSSFLEPNNAGKTKDACPDLGHLLIAALISDVEMTPAVIKSIIKEAVTRNVVWMLEKNPELSYLEPSAVSAYRLKKTFEASKPSYRLLMFLNLFRRTAVGSPRKPLTQLRDEAFARHGAPPRGSAKELAEAVKKIHAVSNFPDFLKMMDIPPPGADWFTNFLRECVQSSMDKGYSRMPITQGQALGLRLAKEPSVAAAAIVSEGMERPLGPKAFLPNQHGGGQRGGRGGRGGGRGGRRRHGRSSYLTYTGRSSYYY